MKTQQGKGNTGAPGGSTSDRAFANHKMILNQKASIMVGASGLTRLPIGIMTENTKTEDKMGGPVRAFLVIHLSLSHFI